ncbi:MAG: D-lysine 5,6-aminomutase subunit alpha [Candidatus Sericytochromatia bacterium]|uniref:D-lysine 5,6-aminomutase subunit alpha n=1 Tax=Candidatus Tanganyikabacteria bacterium TaxID=2961651 RepID=A0A937X117_9BACT|nr:D-lysine 5,6-aminomutase subunit alpha [Candidatus Tanganyikabacteria bacterium]
MNLPIDEAKVARARQLSGEVVRPLLAYFARHSTVAIERAVLRLYGVDGVDADGVPWPNRVIDRLKADGRLGRGAALALGESVVATGLGVQAAAEALAEAGAGSAANVSGADWALSEARKALAAVKASRQRRAALKGRLGQGPTPWKYLIVATGNIYEDVPQAVLAARQGADVIAVIRSTGQSLIDYVPYGHTTYGTGGTYATGANFNLMRKALDEVGEELGRYIQLTNYASGLCMPEITVLAAQEGLDMLLNDALYGILFRDINIYRTLTDQNFSRMLNAFAGVIINTGEDNYLTTADAFEQGHTVLASQFVNERFAAEAGMPPSLMGLGHAFEMNPATEDGLLYEIAMAQLVRQVFPDAPIKWMPPTKHVSGNVFWTYSHNTLFNLVGILTGQTIELLGILTEAIHTPFASDRYLALKNADYVFNYARHLSSEIAFAPDGRIATRARQVLDEAVTLLEQVAADGLVTAVHKAEFGDVSRAPDGGKGLEGVFERGPDYLNPFADLLAAHDRPLEVA